MRQLIIKYGILVIIMTLIARLISAILMIQWPDLLTQVNSDGSTTSFSFGLIERALEYAMNIVIVILMKKDFDKQKIKSTPILIVTFFFSFIGVIFFLLATLQNKLTLKRQMI